MGGFNTNPYDKMANQRGRQAAVVAGMPGSSADAMGMQAQRGFQERTGLFREDMKSQQNMMNAQGMGQLLMMLMMLNRGDMKNFKIGNFSATRNVPQMSSKAEQMSPDEVYSSLSNAPAVSNTGFGGIDPQMLRFLLGLQGFQNNVPYGMPPDAGAY